MGLETSLPAALGEVPSRSRRTRVRLPPPPRTHACTPPAMSSAYRALTSATADQRLRTRTFRADTTALFFRLRLAGGDVALPVRRSDRARAAAALFCRQSPKLTSGAQDHGGRLVLAFAVG